VSPKVLFTVIIKVSGLSLIFGLIDIIPQAVSMTPLLLTADRASQINAALVSFPVLALYIIFIWLSLFKTKQVMNWLSLHQDIDAENITPDISTPALFRIALIVLGGVLLINNIPVLFHDLVVAIRQSQASSFKQTSFEPAILSGTKVILGYLLMDQSRRLASWIGLMSSD
jgi:hypothetical protein